jgi:peptide-methionine (S)-S-oxide reductase
MNKLSLGTPLLLSAALLICGMTAAQSVTLPDSALDTASANLISTAGNPQSQTIVLAGGCFWGIQAVFQHLKGVSQAVSGYAGGSADTARYDMVSSGTTGHAESVQITYDPARISLGKILKVYFSVAHDPTELNRQGPDSGSQYRSEIFFTTPEQEKIAKAYIKQLQKAAVFSAPIVTKVEFLQDFYAAEGYHQNFAALHPNNPYIVINDLPKVAKLQKEFPELYAK